MSILLEKIAVFLSLHICAYRHYRSLLYLLLGGIGNSSYADTFCGASAVLIRNSAQQFSEVYILSRYLDSFLTLRNMVCILL